MGSKIVFASDLDGVICDWNRGVRMCLRKHLSVSLLEDESPDWSYVDRSLSPAQKEWLWTKGITKGQYTMGGAYAGAIDAVQELKKLTEFWIVTSRPIEAEAITVKWCKDKLGIPREFVYFCGGNGAKADIKADVYLDDAPLALLSLVNLRPDSLVLGWKRRWNSELWEREDIDWVSDWETVLMHVTSLGGNYD